VKILPTTYSPLRYPGGKTQLYPFIANLLKNNKINGTYIEPFAGGAGVAIKLLLNNEVSQIWINDFDVSIFSVWFYILNEPQKLIDLIQTVPFDYKTGHLHSKDESMSFWYRQRDIYNTLKHLEPSLELAFATLFLNRTNRSGIISGGPIGGPNQNHKTQIYARFNKKTLIEKINQISLLKDRIILTNRDALSLVDEIKNTVDASDSFIFFDPPYFNQGSNLYYTSFNERDHQTMANKILELNDFFWITTYDVAQEIKEDYSAAPQKYLYKINYSANNKKRGKAQEYLFASNNLNVKTIQNIKLESFD
jgi:DNA adenine methylase